MAQPDTEEGASAPARFGKYEVLQRIAVGGMAEIYLARTSGPVGFEKIVVVKRIIPDLARNKEVVELFLNEARLAATLHHPNIVQVYDVGVDNDDYYFAMEFVQGEDLRAVLSAAKRDHGHVPLDVAISIVIGMCSGMHYAHKKEDYHGKPLNIIHRDISPSNVLVSYDGSVKVVDFGIAKAATRSLETQQGVLRGKYSYMSPEQCQAMPLDRRSDVFAIAIVLFELTTTTKLFRGDSDFEVLKKIIETPNPSPSKRVPGFSPALEKIIARGLCKDREERYQTAEELQLALEAFALDQRLAVSSVTLSRYMERAFSEKIAAWKAVADQGGLLGANPSQGSPTSTFLSMLVTARAAGTDPERSDPVDKSGSRATEKARGNRGGDEDAGDVDGDADTRAMVMDVTAASGPGLPRHLKNASDPPSSPRARIPATDESTSRSEPIELLRVRPQESPREKSIAELDAAASIFPSMPPGAAQSSANSKRSSSVPMVIVGLVIVLAAGAAWFFAQRGAPATVVPIANATKPSSEALVVTPLSPPPAVVAAPVAPPPPSAAPSKPETQPKETKQTPPSKAHSEHSTDHTSKAPHKADSHAHGAPAKWDPDDATLPQ